MPCVMPDLDACEREAELLRTRAMLCSIMRSLETVGILGAIVAHHDEGASGVTREQIMAWYADHKLADDARKGG